MKGVCVYQPGTPEKDLSACAYNVHTNIDNFFFFNLLCTDAPSDPHCS